jgi:predicted MFS family arabinose efflux permease
MSRKIIVAALTALTLVTTLAASSGQAQAKNWGAFGVGVAAGALVGAAATSHAYGYYGGPVYVAEPVHHCRFVASYDAWGNYVRTVRVCGW